MQCVWELVTAEVASLANGIEHAMALIYGRVRHTINAITTRPRGGRVHTPLPLRTIPALPLLTIRIEASAGIPVQVSLTGHCRQLRRVAAPASTVYSLHRKRRCQLGEMAQA